MKDLTEMTIEELRAYRSEVYGEYERRLVHLTEKHRDELNDLRLDLDEKLGNFTLEIQRRYNHDQDRTSPGE